MSIRILTLATAAASIVAALCGGMAVPVDATGGGVVVSIVLSFSVKV